MSILKNKLIKTKKYSQLSLYFVIFAILATIAFLIFTYSKSSKQTSLQINSYIELNLANFNQVKGLWLEKNPNRQKLLNLWDQYLQKTFPKLPNGLFSGKISIIDISTPSSTGEQAPTTNPEGEQAPALSRTEGLARLQDVGIQTTTQNNLLIIADISGRAATRIYLDGLGVTQESTQKDMLILNLNQPIFGSKTLYFAFKDQQIIMSSNIDSLNLALNPRLKFKFPEKNLLKLFSSDSKFLKIYSKTSNLNFLSSFLESSAEAEPFWLFAGLELDKIVLNYETSNQKNRVARESWLNFIPNSPSLIIFSGQNRFITAEVAKTIENQPLITDINLQKDLYSLTKTNQSMLIIQPKDAKSKNFTLKPSEINYTLVISNPKKLNSISKDLKNLEQIVKNVFAKQYPSEKLAKLPDNSTITEFVADPNVYKFQEKIIKLPQGSQKETNISVKYLQKDNLEFAYAIFSDKIAFSNSIKSLDQLFSAVPTTQPEAKITITNCLNDENIPSDFIYFVPKPDFEQRYGVKKMLVADKKLCIY